MMGLEWGDIDDDFIHVRRAINAKGVTTGGKNGYAKRDFPQTRQTRDILKAQEKYRQSPNNPHERVFGNTGQLCYRERWAKFCKFNGIPYITPYELRHTFRSIYKGEISGLPESEKNIPTFQNWTIEEIMGHVHAGMPGVYGHTLDGDMDMVPQLLESVFDARLKRGEEIYLKKFCKNPLPSDSTS